jgi:hypothetical protein
MPHEPAKVLAKNQTFFERLVACLAWAFSPSPPFFRSSRITFYFVCLARLATDKKTYE